MVTFHRRPLPDDLDPLDSERGRARLVEAVAAGTAASFFPLVSQLHTQAWCGLGTLVTTLNALGVDPGRTWKGPWRHFSEDLLLCCQAMEQAASEGFTLVQIGCVARCNGAELRGVVAEAGTLPAFREDLRACVVSNTGPFLVVNYLRSALGQTGTGHFSPIGAWHADTDQALILDVARFKYPPHWVPVERLHAAMTDVDPASGHPRGWLVLHRSEAPVESRPSCR